MNNNYIYYKGYKISYKDLDDFFSDMKKRRDERDDLLEDIAFKHEDILFNYNKIKPPIDDTSLNFFKFKTIGEIKSDNSLSNKHLNFTLNNSLFILLNNIVEKKKEEELTKRITRMETMIYVIFGFCVGSYVFSFI
jgi:hypothetical protein